MSFKEILFKPRLFLRRLSQKSSLDLNYNRKSHIPLFGATPTSVAQRNRLRLIRSVAVSLGRPDYYSNCRTYSTTVKESKVKMPEAKPFERLPNSVKPTHYNLVITPDLKAFTFQGEVSIQIEVGLTYARFLINVCL